MRCYLKLKTQLEIREVTVEHIEQYNKLLRYVFQVTNQSLNNYEWEETEIIKAKSPIVEKSDVIGWFDGDNLVSQLAVYPLKVRIFDQTYDMAGLTGVGTYPEYAGMGLMNKLIERALLNMRAKGQTISYLYPYSIPYYRKKGWEIVTDKISYEITDHQLPKRKNVKGKVVRVAATSTEVKDTYHSFALQTHGALIRDELAWNEYFLWEKDDLLAAVYYSEDDELDGYVLYRIANEVFFVKEMIFINEDARNGLWNFIGAHFSMVTKIKGHIYTDETLAFLLEDADIQEIISPYYMARIVDVEGFIAKYNFEESVAKSRSWIFNLDDPILECNKGVFKLEIDAKGEATIKKVSAKTDDKIDIQTLTTMLLGYKSPTYLQKIGRISCSKESIDMLDDAIRQESPYFSDYF